NSCIHSYHLKGSTVMVLLCTVKPLSLPLPDLLAPQPQYQHRDMEEEEYHRQTPERNSVSTVCVPRSDCIYYPKRGPILQTVKNDKSGIGTFEIHICEVGVNNITTNAGTAVPVISQQRQRDIRHKCTNQRYNPGSLVLGSNAEDNEATRTKQKRQ